MFFIEVCKARNLNPLLRQIHALKRFSKEKNKQTGKEEWVGKLTMQTAIDGFILIAERTGKYRGCKTWTTGKFSPNLGEGDLKGHALIHKKDCEPHEVEIRFWEFAQTNFGEGGKQFLAAMWKRMPHWMIEKVALARCFARAFPEDLSGLYIDDEMPAVEIHPSEVNAKLTEIHTPKTIAPKMEAPIDEDDDGGAFVYEPDDQLTDPLEYSLKTKMEIRGTQIKGMQLGEFQESMLLYFLNKPAVRQVLQEDDVKAVEKALKHIEANK